jgi:hypothetical protein
MTHVRMFVNPDQTVAQLVLEDGDRTVDLTELLALDLPLSVQADLPHLKLGGTTMYEVFQGQHYRLELSVDRCTASMELLSDEVLEVLDDEVQVLDEV